MERREFLKIAGVAGATTAAFGCSPKATEKLIPYLVPQDEIVPGIATWYATLSGDSPDALGVRVKTREGRPILIQGNPEHPLSGGSISALAQSEIQGLYDPDRVRGPALRAPGGRFNAFDWKHALDLLVQQLAKARGDGIYVLTGHVTGTLDGLIDRWLAAFASPNRAVYEPFAYEALLAANRAVFGQSAIPLYDLASARYLISFGADFLETWLAPTFLSRGFTAMHAFRDGGMGKFVAVEPRLSLTGTNADEWIAPRPGTEMLVALAMANVIAAAGGADPGVAIGDYTPEAVAVRTDVPADTIRRLANEFAEAGPSLALGSGVATTHRRATETWAAVNLLNRVAGNVGRTVRFGPNFNVARSETYAAMSELVRRMNDGRVKVLLVHGANPVYSLPPKLGFAEALAKVPFKVSLSPFYDETAALADLLLPASHNLESWGDAEPLDGVRGLAQPVLPPLHNTRMLGDILLQTARLAGVDGDLEQESFAAYLKQAWSGAGGAVSGLYAQLPEGAWNEALRRGGVFSAPSGALAATRTNGNGGAADTNGPGSAAQAPADTTSAAPGLAPTKLQGVSGTTARPAGAFAGATPAPARGTGDLRFEPASFDGPEDGFYLMPVPTVSLHDGRGANRPWMQELPDPVTKAVWGSWIEIHPDTAARLGIVAGEMLEVESPHGRIAAPAFLYPGIRTDTVAVPLGQGHSVYGRFAKDCGANAMTLLPADVDPVSGGRAWFGTRVSLRKSTAPGRLILMQGSPHQHSRGISRALSVAEAQRAEADPAASEMTQRMELVLKDAAADSPYRWGMTIDLAKCVGCSACVTACYMENNIKTVGPDDSDFGRELSWLRIERYWDEPEPGAEAAPFRVRNLPMLCQHCGQAPCEPVCPVYAAYHNPDGLNAQVYNRCVGTRYCANNCPYKVRKFNFFEQAVPEPLNLQFNPDVTVRTKGVMEKCTFCVQRIREAKIHAKLEGREVADGELVTACQAACPTQAIVFGNLRDTGSRVYREAMSGRGYNVLADLNTRSAVTYLADVVHTDRVLRGSAGEEEPEAHGTEGATARRESGGAGAVGRRG
jgi:molybdopterin-containing oxidoreductase family iron-sulfur binding subunit